MDYNMNDMNYNGFQSVGLQDKVKNIWYNYKKYIILSACVLVVVIISLIVLLNPKESELSNYSNIERIMILNAQNYIKNNKIEDNVYVSCKVKPELMVKKGDILICSRNSPERAPSSPARFPAMDRS